LTATIALGFRQAHHHLGWLVARFEQARNIEFLCEICSRANAASIQRNVHLPLPNDADRKKDILIGGCFGITKPGVCHTIR
jgi:hypothetical protein